MQAKPGGWPGVFDVTEKEKEAEKIQAEMGEPGFWDDRAKAEDSAKRLGILNEYVNRWHVIEESIAKLEASYDENAFYELRKQFREFEREELFTGHYDKGAAVLSIFPARAATMQKTGRRCLA